MSFKNQYKDPERRREAVTAYNRKYYRKTAIYPPRIWTDQEIEMLFNSKMTDRELSSVLHRSMKAIVNKRSSVRQAMEKAKLRKGDHDHEKTF